MLVQIHHPPFMNEAGTFEYVALDTETTGLDAFNSAAPFLVSTFSESEEAKVWEFEVNPFTRKVAFDSDKVHDLRSYIRNKRVVFHHAKFDLRMLSILGLNVFSKTPKHLFRTPLTRKTRGLPCPILEYHDTQLMSHVVNSQGAGKTNGDYGMHGLKALALVYLDIPESDEGELRRATISARDIARQLGWKIGDDPGTDYWLPKTVWNCRAALNEPVPETWSKLCEKYAVTDVVRTLSLFFVFQEIINRDGLQKNYDRELSLSRVTYNMEHEGMFINKEALFTEMAEFTAQCTVNKQRAEEILHIENANSPQQLSRTLTNFGITLTKKTKKGNPSVDAQTLRDLARKCEVSENPTVQEAGKALRLISGFDPDDGDNVDEKIPGYKTYSTGVNYLNNYLSFMDTNNKVHPSFNQTGTAWTRYSSSSPNGQNISKKAVLPLRRVFSPPPGYVWLPFDYEQLELRIFAFASGDIGLIDAFNKGADFHMATACEMFECSPEEITSERRRAAKYVNFGIIYGAGPDKVDEQSGRPGTYELYMSKFPSAKNYMSNVLRGVIEKGFVTTLGGYRLYVRDDKPYAAVNGIIQGTAGEIVKNSMVQVHEQGLIDWEPPTEGLPFGGSSLICNIHDELVFQFPKHYPYEEIGRQIIKVMEGEGSKLGVVTPVSGSLITTNWGEGEDF